MTAKTKQILIPFLVLIAVALLIALLMATKKAPEKKPPEKRIPFVATTTIATAPIQLQVTSQGLVEPVYRTQIVAQVAGEVVWVDALFAKGNLVKKGVLLGQIDPFNYEVKLQQAKASLASARANFILERAQGQVAEAEWAKISNSEPSELGLRKPQQEQALATVKAAEAALKQAQKDLDRTRITAPFDGIIEQRQISPGGYLNIGSAVGQIADISRAEIRLPVSQQDLAYLVKQGADAEVVMHSDIAGQNHTWNARIVRSEGVLDPQTRMHYLVAEYLDPYATTTAGQPLVFGSFVSAAIKGIEIPSAVRVPRTVLRDHQIPVALNGKLHLVDVSVARHEGKDSVIENGLVSGMHVIISALDHPIEGMQVKLLNQVEQGKAQL